jgi:hypothetical protein
MSIVHCCNPLDCKILPSKPGAPLANADANCCDRCKRARAEERDNHETVSATFIPRCNALGLNLLGCNDNVVKGTDRCGYHQSEEYLSNPLHYTKFDGVTICGRDYVTYQVFRVAGISFDEMGRPLGHTDANSCKECLVLLGAMKATLLHYAKEGDSATACGLDWRANSLTVTDSVFVPSDCQPCAMCCLKVERCGSKRAVTAPGAPTSAASDVRHYSSASGDKTLCGLDDLVDLQLRSMPVVPTDPNDCPACRRAAIEQTDKALIEAMRAQPDKLRVIITTTPSTPIRGVEPAKRSSSGCPLCGDRGAYVGLAKVECSTEGCRNFSYRAFEEMAARRFAISLRVPRADLGSSRPCCVTGCPQVATRWVGPTRSNGMDDYTEVCVWHVDDVKRATDVVVDL